MPIRLLSACALVGLLLAPAASAHQTWHDDGKAQTPASKVRFVYGNLFEPVSTFQKTGVDLGIFDAKGTPLTGLEAIDHASKAVPDPPIRVTLLYSGQTKDLASCLKAQFNRPGWYSCPIIYTRPGAYQLRVAGTINGTAVDVTIDPAHEVPDAAADMWPAAVDTPDELQARIATLESEVADLKAQSSSKGAPALDVGILVGLLAFAAIATRKK